MVQNKLPSDTPGPQQVIVSLIGNKFESGAAAFNFAPSNTNIDSELINDADEAFFEIAYLSPSLIANGAIEFEDVSTSTTIDTFTASPGTEINRERGNDILSSLPTDGEVRVGALGDGTYTFDVYAARLVVTY